VRIGSPEALRKLSLSELEELAEDIRSQIISVSMKNGGHLGASLGAVEIAIALHFVFESPREALIWDVGHQAYAHKMITGRWDHFDTLRQAGGISGFLSRAESPHDLFGAGHSSTSLSVALAIAWSKGREKKMDWTTAIIGDGGLTAGIAFEALNNIAVTPAAPLLILVNDNQMSISENVGNLSRNFAHGNAKAYFELQGLDYVGPIDGHNLATLLGTLKGIKNNYCGKPIVVHAMTQKGKGYSPAEESPAYFHGVSPVQYKTPGKSAVKQKSFSDALGEAICELAEKDDRIVAVTAAMSEGTGLAQFARKFPERFFDVGIAEPHAVTFAAGLATQGWKPVVAIYSTFLQRALDSLIHDVALQNLNVTFAIDRAGLVGADGPTHHGAFDLSYLGLIPGFEISAPEYLGDIKILLERAIAHNGPSAIRYPRGGAQANSTAPIKNEMRLHVSAAHPELIAIGLGVSGHRLIEAAQGIQTDTLTVLSTTQAKPISKAIEAYLNQHPSAPILSVEEGSIQGGFGSTLATHFPSREVICLGYGDRFYEHGTPAQLEEQVGITVPQLRAKLKSLLKK